MKRRLFSHILIVAFILLVSVASPLLAGFRHPESLNQGVGGQMQTLGGEQKIAFMSDRSGRPQIYLMDPDGSNVVHLPTPGEARFPRWSPDGTKILFRSHFDEDQKPSISMIYRDGSNLVTLVKSQEDGGPVTLSNGPFRPNWSPDGTKIIFPTVDQGLYVMALDGSGLLQLTNNDTDSGPAWSPDGANIAFQRQPVVPGNADLFVMDADGTNATNVTNTPANHDLYPDWSPDGTTIAFQRQNDIWTMNPDGSNQINIGTPDEDQMPSWSPDGTQLVFWTNFDAGSFFSADIFTANSDGSNAVNLTTHPAADGQPDWSPVLLAPIPPAMRFAADSFTVSEAGGVANLTVTLHQTPTITATVAYSTTQGTALAGQDYIQSTGTITFTPGISSATIAIPVIDDSVSLEPTETFSVTLSGVTGAELWPPTVARVDILEDDTTAPPVTATIATPVSPPVTTTVSFSTSIGIVNVALQNVTTGGTLTMTASIVSPPGSPGTFTLLNRSFDLDYDGGFDGVQIGFSYGDEEVAAAGIPEQSLRLLHYEFGKWKDATVGLDTTANIITGTAATLSPSLAGVLNMPDCAITINSGSIHTGLVDVAITSDTAGAAEMLISNDAGFAGAQWQPYQTTVPWMLIDPGQQIVTLITYVRLRDAGVLTLCGGLSLSDDIIFDPLPPTVQPGLARATLLLDATDQQNGSGVEAMQLATTPDLVGVPWQAYNNTPEVNMGETVYVRVRDGVGNVSGIVSAAAVGELYLPLVLR